MGGRHFAPHPDCVCEVQQASPGYFACEPSNEIDKKDGDFVRDGKSTVQVQGKAWVGRSAVNPSWLNRRSTEVERRIEADFSKKMIAAVKLEKVIQMMQDGGFDIPKPCTMHYRRCSTAFSPR